MQILKYPPAGEAGIQDDPMDGFEILEFLNPISLTNNPVEAGFADNPLYWLFSSDSDYNGKADEIEICFPY